MKLFSTLTRDDCVALARIDKSVVQAAYRVEQLKLLRDLLRKRGSSYYEEATWEFFQSLAPYEETQYHSYQGEMPECVLKSFKIMFDAFDEFITDMIGDHYELQGWDDPLGEVVWCEDLLMNRRHGTHIMNALQTEINTSSYAKLIRRECLSKILRATFKLKK